MALLADILSVTFPFFALVLCGFATSRRRWMPYAAIPGLNYLVLYLALPCMLYQFAAETPIPSLMDVGTVTTYVIGALLMLTLSIATTLRQARGWRNASFVALVAAFPNSGFMGVPLLVALLGQQAAAPCIVALSIDMVLTTSLCIASSQLDGASGRGAIDAALGALRGIVKNPLPWSILLGSLSSATGLQLPAVADHTVKLLAQAASPVALFALGCMLAYSYEKPARDIGTTHGSTSVARITLYKLVLHPAVVFLTSQLVMRSELALSPYNAMILVLTAALPSASNVPILADRYGADTGRLTRIVMVTTVLAFASFTVAVLLLVPADALARP